MFTWRGKQLLVRESYLKEMARGTQDVTFPSDDTSVTFVLLSIVNRVRRRYVPGHIEIDENFGALFCWP